MEKTSFYSLTYLELKQRLGDAGLNQIGANRLFNYHYKKKNIGFLSDDLAKNTQRFIKNTFDFNLPRIALVNKADDKTVKFLFELKDGKKVETVLIPFHNKYSICLSSQVGCAMKCSFCHTGLQGLSRHLKTEEIIGQFLSVCVWLRENRPFDGEALNIVFMGQGEPLHNFNEVSKACKILLSQHGASIAAQRITVSTAGYLPGIKRWRDEMPAVNLALSLHSPVKSKRDELIPLNRAYPLEDVLKEIDKIELSRKQFVTYEYLLIDEFNNSEEDAQMLGKLLEPRRALLNIIPFNPVPGLNYKRPTSGQVKEFACKLSKFDLPVLVRDTKGDEVMAACGQLNSDN